MTPTATSYTIPTSVTGYTSAQTINPSELNLWRVIKVNTDGTVEMVIEYVSSEDVYFFGEKGYKNFVDGLNTIAAQYTNEKYVQSTRHMGYSNQLGYCEGMSSTVCPTDDGYLYDYNFVIDTLDTAAVNGLGSYRDYWVPSRLHTASSSYGADMFISSRGSDAGFYVNFVYFGNPSYNQMSEGKGFAQSSFSSLLAKCHLAKELRALHTNYLGINIICLPTDSFNLSQ